MHSYTTMGAVACVRTRAQLLTLLSCAYIPLTALAQKSKTVDKGRMSITVDHGYYRPAFVVLDTTLFDQVGDFQMALRPGFLPHRLALWRAGVRGMAVGACGCNMWVMALSLLLGLTHASSATPPPPAIPPIGGEPLLSHPLLTYTGCRRVSAMSSPLRQHTWLPMSLLATHTRDLAASRTTPILSLLFCSGSPQSSLVPILPSLWSLEAARSLV